MNQIMFDNFTNQYSLSKTLRFELKPMGKDGKWLGEKEAENVFNDIIKKDREIKDAYDALKPVMDKIHEEVINKSLLSAEARKIDFSKYFKLYKNKSENMWTEEKRLCAQIGKTYNIGAKWIRDKAGTDSKGKSFFKKKTIDCLFENGLMKFIEKEQKNYTNERLSEARLKECLETFKGFFTYFSGYSQNRKNYYVVKEERATAIATRIVYENLPKFCDNCIQFSGGQSQKSNKKNGFSQEVSRKQEYLNVYKFLEKKNRITQIKDSRSGEMVEVCPINEKMFEITKFSECLAQNGLEEYNRIIGQYNLLINLYNQARNDDKDFKKLDKFKTLYKQIGCEKRKAFIFALRYATKAEQTKGEQDKTTDILNLEEMLENMRAAGQSCFGKISEKRDIRTVLDFVRWLRERSKENNWSGVYWSKAAVDKISNLYLANWHDITDRLQAALQNKTDKEKYRSVASYNKKREEPLKLNDAVELAGLFGLIDVARNSADWSKSFFRESILTDRESIIDERLSPGQNIMSLICADLETAAKAFCAETVKINAGAKTEKEIKIAEIKNYKDEDNKLALKEWLEQTKIITRTIKYFSVKESKIKGKSINSELANALEVLLQANDAPWDKWYDIVRNYLTQKPQDTAKKNKLKLNFANPQLLNGWSDGQEKNKSAIIIKKGNKYCLGLLKKRNLFDTSKKNNPVYISSNTEAGRLILKNLSFKTLAGKGFVSRYNEKYSDMSKRNTQEAINKLQALIKDNYVSKYPLLRQIAEKEYSDKRLFDEELKDLLIECYACDFKPINWNYVLQQTGNKNIYIFEIYTKDFSAKSTGKANLQTLYWEQVFRPDSFIQLCGGGKIFFRKKAVQDAEKIVHPAKQPILRRSDGQTVSVFNHEILKDKRFAEEKYLFHVPIKLNYQKPTPNTNYYKYEFNKKINEYLGKNSDVLFLGINRGEKNLIYYSLVDVDGNIIEQDSFNIINGKNYYTAIDEKARKRQESRKNWQEIGKINDLKNGYISLVVHELAKKILNKPTFIVLEYLSSEFKRGRQKIEKQVYQKFELALAKKLNYLVDKNAKIGELGSVVKALQLTPPAQTYQDIEGQKQFGIMLYARANYVSVTDPATGWRKTIYLKKGGAADIKKQISERFSDIGYQSGDYYFEYVDNAGKYWKLWSGQAGSSLERYRFKRGKDKNESIIESYNIKEMLDKLFINFAKNQSLLKQLKAGKTLTKFDDKNTAWESLRFAIDLIQQIRNSGDKNKGQADNFLLSPVRNNFGEHFDSRNYQEQENPGLPKDADANGAYNIARKGIIMYEHIKQHLMAGKQNSELDLFVRDEEWDLWLLDKKEWGKHLPDFAAKKQRQAGKK
jgi:CRISPR-associated protein Cpf1